MSRTLSERIDTLFEFKLWPEARGLLERRLRREPQDHWIITQLAAVNYEEHNYQRALELLERSLKITPRCPLTLWHYAGTHAALGNYREALSSYLWLYVTVINPVEDPCWESELWAQALREDCGRRIESLKETDHSGF